MVESINSALELVSGIVWGWPLVILLLGSGIVLTIYHRFIQYRGFHLGLDLVRGRYHLEKNGSGAVSHFKALCTALSATVGLGNIAGVAVAIKLGGPGATFWMIVVGILGMATKYNECALACLFRRVEPDGRIFGGPMQYIRLVPGGRVLAAFFAFFLIFSAFGAANLFQANQVAIALDSSFGLSPLVTGIILGVLTALVIMGGMTRIASVASVIVPVMAVFYLGICGYVVWVHRADLIPALVMILQEAFSGSAVAGGAAGSALAVTITAGVRRALFSCEAGLGTAAIAHSIVKTERPVSEGFVALLEPFIDTVIICTSTALAIILTGAWQQPIEGGVGMTTFAFESVFPGFGGYFVAVAVFLFAFSTLVSWSLYGEQATQYLFGAGVPVNLYRFVFSLLPIVGAVWTVGPIINFADICLAMLVIPNLWAFFFLSGRVRQESALLLADYRKWREAERR